MDRPLLRLWESHGITLGATVIVCGSIRHRIQNIQGSPRVHHLPASRTALVVPCFNESKRWDLDYWIELLSISSLSLVFVNDGSTDLTLECLKRLAQFSTKVHVIELPDNLGKAEAIRCGLIYCLNSNYQFIGYLDADCAFQFSDVQRIITFLPSEHYGNFDAIWSSRVKLSGRRIERSMFRHYVSRVLITLLSVRLRLPFYDSQSGFKVFRASVLRDVTPARFKTKWFIDIELFLRYRNLTGSELKVWEEPLRAWTEIGGSNLGIHSTLKVSREMLLLSRNYNSKI